MLIRTGAILWRKLPRLIGMSVREIRGHLEELYGIDVSADLISAVTDAVLEEVAEWQNFSFDRSGALTCRNLAIKHPSIISNGGLKGG
jgi:hypothetical protein